MSKKAFRTQASSERAAEMALASNGFSPGRTVPSFGRNSTLSSVELSDISSISDANIKITFKNLTKKDATTRIKALEDLESYMQSLRSKNELLGVGVLEAWANIYPRLSIDTARRVRQLAHQTLGQVAVLSGKQLARHMQDVIGAWLAGTYDSDRLVKKAAEDSFEQRFASQEKRREVWKVYIRSILEHCRNCILRETVRTLSDERTVSQDDAEAKYARVVATAICLLDASLSHYKLEESEKAPSLSSEIIGARKLWEYTVHQDANVRRAVYRLLSSCLELHSDFIEPFLPVISAFVLTKALSIEQAGSAWEYSRSLTLLTLNFPGAWTSPKKPKLSHFLEYMKRGSQGGPPEVWDNCATIVMKIPEELLPSEAESIAGLLKAMQNGFRRKEDPKGHLPIAWANYLRLASFFLKKFSDEVDQCQIAKFTMLPLFEQCVRVHLLPKSASEQISLSVCVSATELISSLKHNRVSNALELEWMRVAELVTKDIKSLPLEKSPKTQESQEVIATEGDSFARLCGAIWDSPKGSPSLRAAIENSAFLLIDHILPALKIGNDEWPGVALVLESLLQCIPRCILLGGKAFEAISHFFDQDLRSLKLSPSFPSLLSSLHYFSRPIDTGGEADPYSDRRLLTTRNALEGTMKAILDEPDTDKQLIAAQHLIAFYNNIDRDTEQYNKDLETFIIGNFQSAMSGSGGSWGLVVDAVLQQGAVLSIDKRGEILNELTNGLSNEDEVISAMNGVHSLSERSPTILAEIALSNRKFLADLLFLTDASDEQIAAQAEAAYAVIESTLIANNPRGYMEAITGLIHRDLTELSSRSFSISYLVICAEKVLKSIHDQPRQRSLVKELFPSSEDWISRLEPFLRVAPNSSLAITDIIGSSLFVVQSGKESQQAFSLNQYDNNGYSAPLRIGMYVIRLITTTVMMDGLDNTVSAGLFAALLLTAQLANDDLGLHTANQLIKNRSETDYEVMEFVSETQKLFTGQPRKSEDAVASSALKKTQEFFRANALGVSPFAFYNARALAYLTAELLALYGRDATDTEAVYQVLKDLSNTQDLQFFLNIAVLEGYYSSASLTEVAVKTCNQLISDLTGRGLSMDRQRILRKLVLLNLVLKWDEVAGKVPQHRLLLFVKNLLSWVDDGLLASASTTAEVARTLCAIIPLISDVYGSHWLSSLELISRYWSGVDNPEAEVDSQLTAIHATLKLLGVLRAVYSDNEDAEDAWKSSIAGLSRSLVRLLELAPNIDDNSHQPLRIVNGILAREIAKISVEHINIISELYPLLYAASASVQRASFGLLHRFIPADQEQASIEAAVSKKSARLPEELISLVIETPKSEDLPAMIRTSHNLLTIRGYLLSWVLIFDHFTGSSFKARSDYVEQLIEGSYGAGLLDCIFDVLRLERGKTIDASQFDITSYSPEEGEANTEREIWGLAIHLYYLSLKHLPAMTKSWWINCPRSQMATTIESWTERYISPIVVSDELDKVSEWADSTSQQEDGNMKVKVTKKAREVTAGYEVDEQMMQIVIKLPGAYPLRQATVEGPDRVGVDSKKWRSWLLSTQGVITFSNGSVIDGLIAWRRNVTGALKGQTECAICYSIISADKQLPSKKCGTCKNFFHSSCLYKWFKSSNSPSCPLCRNAFTYG